MLAKDHMQDFQELADEAFTDLLAKLVGPLTWRPRYARVSRTLESDRPRYQSPGGAVAKVLVTTTVGDHRWGLEPADQTSRRSKFRADKAARAEAEAVVDRWNRRLAFGGRFHNDETFTGIWRFIGVTWEIEFDACDGERRAASTTGRWLHRPESADRGWAHRVWVVETLKPRPSIDDADTSQLEGAHSPNALAAASKEHRHGYAGCRISREIVDWETLNT
jgi:hypothetical protein